MKYLVQGNYRQFQVTLTQKQGELITPYVPTDADEVSIILRGARTYEYPDFEQSSNVLTFTDNGCLKVGLYALEVKIVESTTHRLRCMYREQIRVVASNDDVPTNADFEQDDIELQAEFEVAASVIVVDDELSLTSTNPVQNKVVTAALNSKADNIDIYEDAEDGALVYRVDLRCGNTDISTAIIPYATSLLGGLMSVSDKTKLDALPTNSDLQTALNAKGETLAGEITAAGYEIELKSGNTILSAVYVPYVDAQTDGLMSASDYSKLAALPTADTLNTTLAGKADGISTQPNAGNVQIDLKSGNTTLATAYILDADAYHNGLMSASDYSKLAALPTNADLTTALNGKQATLTWDSAPTQNSTNPVTSGGLYVVLGDIESILDNINGD